MNATEVQSKHSQQVFLSYAAADKAVARRIAQAIRGAGLNVWFDEWKLKPGEPLLLGIEEALSASDLFLVLLSPRSLESEWIRLELNAFLSLELRARAVTLITVLLADCEIPPLLADFQFVDLRHDFEGGIQDLIQQLTIASLIDFSSLDGRSFENLVADLLIEQGFKIEREPLDTLFDFRASLTTQDPFGTLKHETWLVALKLYRFKRVSLDLLARMFDHMKRLPETCNLLIVTSGQLTSVADEFLNEITAKSRQKFRVIEGTELKSLLLRNPHLVHRYFAEGIEQ